MKSADAHALMRALHVEYSRCTARKDEALPFRVGVGQAKQVSCCASSMGLPPRPRRALLRSNLYLPEPLDSSVMIAIGSTETCDQEMGMSGGGWVSNADQTLRWTAMSSIPSPSSRRGGLGLTHRTMGRKQLGRKQLGRKQLDVRSFRREYSRPEVVKSNLRKMGHRPRGRRGERHVTPSERRNSLMARHAVCSAPRGREDLVEIANPGLKP
jgi:hypothetical protein